MERELSFGIGEFIVSASKLGVTHAPGAATFQLIGALWSTLAFGDGGSYAIVMNSMSAISSGATIMFLFWTITHFARRMFSVTVTNHINDDNYNTQLTKSQNTLLWKWSKAQVFLCLVILLVFGCRSRGLRHGIFIHVNFDLVRL